VGPDRGLALEHANRCSWATFGQLACDRQAHDSASDNRKITPRWRLRGGGLIGGAQVRNCIAPLESELGISVKSHI
jgi:hypothetical protein